MGHGYCRQPDAGSVLRLRRHRRSLACPSGSWGHHPAHGQRGRVNRARRRLSEVTWPTSAGAGMRGVVPERRLNVGTAAACFGTPGDGRWAPKTAGLKFTVNCHAG
jgi:hypothetical protein